MSWKERRDQKRAEKDVRRGEKAAKQQEEWSAVGILYKTHGYAGKKGLRRELTLYDDRVETEIYTSMLMRPDKHVLPYENVDSVSLDPGVLRGSLVFQAGGRTIEVDAFRPARLKKFALEFSWPLRHAELQAQLRKVPRAALT